MLERRRKGGMLAKISAIFSISTRNFYVVFFAFSETKVFAFDSLEGMKVRDDAGLEGCTTERIKGRMDAGSF